MPASLRTSPECEHTETLKTLYHTFVAPMANLSVRAFIIPDGVETTSGVSSCVYPLPRMVTNYLALVLVEVIVTRWTEDGQSSLVGSVENATCNCMFYSGLPALYDLSPGSYLYPFSFGLPLLPTCPQWMHLIHLLGIVTSFILYMSLLVRAD